MGLITRGDCLRRPSPLDMGGRVPWVGHHLTAIRFVGASAASRRGCREGQVATALLVGGGSGDHLAARAGRDIGKSPSRRVGRNRRLADVRGDGSVGVETARACADLLLSRPAHPCRHGTRGVGRSAPGSPCRRTYPSAFARCDLAQPETRQRGGSLPLKIHGACRDARPPCRGATTSSGPADCLARVADPCVRSNTGGVRDQRLIVGLSRGVRPALGLSRDRTRVRLLGCLPRTDSLVPGHGMGAGCLGLPAMATVVAGLGPRSLSKVVLAGDTGVDRSGDGDRSTRPFDARQSANSIAGRDLRDGGLRRRKRPWATLAAG